MAAYKKRRRPVRTALCVLLALCLLAAAGSYALLASRLSALAQGATFEVAYTVRSTAAQPGALYSVLEKAHAEQGSLTGLYAPKKLLLTLYRLNGDEPAAAYDEAARRITLHPEAHEAEPLTRVYISSEETLYDVGQLYATARRALVSAYPLADALLPQWGLGSYISQTQLATVLGTQPGEVAMQDMTAFAPLAPAALRPAHPEQALAGFCYFTLPNTSESADAPTLILGFPLKDLLGDTAQVHLLLTVPTLGVQAEALGIVTAADTVVTAPESRMADEDVAAFAQLRQTVQQLVEFVRQFTE